MPMRRCSGLSTKKSPTERPERLAAEVVAVLLVEDEHPPAGQGQLVGGDEAGQAGADDDDVGFVHAGVFSP